MIPALNIMFKFQPYFGDAIYSAHLGIYSESLLQVLSQISNFDEL